MGIFLFVSAPSNESIDRRPIALAKFVQGLLRAGWLGEIGKIVIAAILFVAVFRMLKPLHPGFLFAGYIATLLALPVGLLFDRGR